jgi:alcohol dehydrogenase
MRAVSYPAYGVTPTLTEVARPSCPDGGVVVEVEATGVCRSDWHAWMGHDPVHLPHVPGHEFAGRVARVGVAVERWRVGDRVTAPFACGCGVCAVCRAGDTHVCPDQTQPGFTHWGSFAEEVVVHAADTNLVALPDGVDAVAAASLGCRFATAYRAVRMQARVAPGEFLAVHGCGGVGLSAVMIAVALGARVVAVDVSPAALALARDLGAETVIDGAVGGGDADAPQRVGATSGSAGVVAALRDATEGGAHASIDAVGSVATALASVGSLRRRGRHVQVGLMLAGDAILPLPMGPVIAGELEILGSHGLAAADYPGLLDLVASGAVDPRRLVGTVIGLEQAGAALAAMSDPAPGRPGMTVVSLLPSPHQRHTLRGPS